MRTELEIKKALLALAKNDSFVLPDGRSEFTEGERETGLALLLWVLNDEDLNKRLFGDESEV